MTCDKLNVFGLREYSRHDLFVDTTDAIREADRFYIMTEADVVLKDNEELIAKKDKEIAKLKQKLESVQASMYADVVDANMEIRRLKRALYNLRACYADMMQKRYIECKTDGWVHRVNKWIEVERRCLKKAEEYK